MEIVQADNEVGWFICAACFRSNLRYSPMWMRPHHVAIQNDIGTMIRYIYNDQLDCIRIGERMNIQETCRSSKPAFPMVVLFLQMLS